jgi:hypothetical protein
MEHKNFSLTWMISFSCVGRFTLFMVPAFFTLTILLTGSAYAAFWKSTEDNVSFSANLTAKSPEIPTFETGKKPAQEIHVATTGNDSTGTGSEQKPYRTINRAVRLIQAGTAVRIHTGTYSERVNVEDHSGTADAPIWIGGAAGESRPIVTSGSEGLHLTRVRYLILHDLEVRQTSQNGVNTDDGGDYADSQATEYVLFRNLYIHDIGGSGNEDCLKLSGVNHYYVLNSEFSACGGDGSGSGIDHVGCHDGLILGNYFYQLSANAVQCKGGSARIEIRANHMNNSGERSVNIGGSTDYTYFRPPLSTTQPNYEASEIRVIANLIEGSIAPLAFVGARDSLAANNTIIHPSNWLLRILQETVTGNGYTFLPSGNNRVINNLFYYDRSDLSTYVNIGPNTSPATFQFSNNLWFAYDNPSQSKPNLPVTETNGIAGLHPLFIDFAAGDYRLQSNSPAIGKGIRISEIGMDYLGLNFNTPPSIGALEGNPPSGRRIYLPRIIR